MQSGRGMIIFTQCYICQPVENVAFPMAVPHNPEVGTNACMHTGPKRFIQGSAGSLLRLKRL